MINEKDTGALINQIRDVTRDHIDWIKSQLLKPNNFMAAKGREVWIDVPNSKLKNIVTIPSKNEPNYREAWVRVYNLAVDYLEGSLSYAFMSGKLDYKKFNWPDFDPSNADYARGLEEVLDEFKLMEEKRLKEEEEKSKLMVTKSSVVLTPVNVENIGNYIEESKVEQPVEQMPRHVAHNEYLNLVPPVEEMVSDAIEPEFQTNEQVVEVSNEKMDYTSKFEFQKILDGDKLTKKDFRDIPNNINLMVIPCQDVDNIKEEKLFFENMRVCADESVKTGAMIYGHATEEREAAYELKKIFKLLDQCDEGFTKCVIYEVNDKFVLKNKDSEMKLLSFINAYTLILEGLAKDGFIPILSMNLSSKKILKDIYERYNLESKFETVYRVLVRELDDLDKEDSTILLDPQYDYDVITLRDPRFKTGDLIRNSIDENNTALAKVA